MENRENFVKDLYHIDVLLAKYIKKLQTNYPADALVCNFNLSTFIYLSDRVTKYYFKNYHQLTIKEYIQQIITINYQQYRLGYTSYTTWFISNYTSIYVIYFI